MMTREKKVLIVDDDRRNVFALDAVLRANDYKAVSVSDASEAISLLQHDPEIAVMLMDMMMPGMDGYEAIATIRKLDTVKQIPIIAVTAQAMPGDREKCLDAGADKYLAKPINVDVLMNLLQQYI